MAPALGLGEITLHSALNQPFEAEIELLEVGDLGAQDLRVGLAPAEVFSRSGWSASTFSMICVSRRFCRDHVV